jgi:hypothetical protein
VKKRERKRESYKKVSSSFDPRIPYTIDGCGGTGRSR